MSLEGLFEKLWSQYTSLTSQAKSIHDLLERNGETVLNDHVAFRTYNHSKLGIQKIAQTFEKHGYVKKGDYVFEEKKLNAIHLEHPQESLPKIFISELLIEKLDPSVQQTINAICDSIPNEKMNSQDFCYSGRLWDIDYSTYQNLLKHSEYAAWLSAFGFCANHFTVNVNALKGWDQLEDLNSFLKSNGYKLNESGGEIKGDPSVYLEQSSTLAGVATVDFKDGKKEIPSCYYEFAKRYPTSNGKLYQGFVEKSADKIFESTDVKR